MRVLKKSQLLKIAAGITVNGVTVMVSSQGIPDIHFDHIEYAFQMYMQKQWNTSKVAEYLEQTKSIVFIETYLANFEMAIQ